jgi:diaminopimelate epimerase
MEEVTFYKMSGSGNDFIIVDNRSGLFSFSDVPLAVAKLCRRGLSIGADGVILLEKTDEDKVDFAWEFYNADGSRATMCGNGARCAARLAYLLGISGKTVSFLTAVGVITAHILAGGRVRLRTTPPGDIRLHQTITVDTDEWAYHFAHTGVPHVVIEVPDVEEIPVFERGRRIRYHPDFSPEGANVNFVSVKEGGIVRIRTYERGVEGETYACGTGAVAAAITLARAGKVKPPVSLLPKSGIDITIDFEPKEDSITDVFLEGDARLIYTGTINNEAFD